MTGPKVLGLDISLNASGIAGIVGGRCWTDTIRVGQLTGHQRVEAVLATLRDHVNGKGWSLAVIEGLAYNAQDAGLHLAGLNHHVRHLLWKAGVPYAVVPTSTMKVYATGRGRLPKGVAGKKLVLAASREHYARLMPVPSPGDPADLETIATFDEADALTLGAMGWDWLTGQPLCPGLPASHRRALGSVQWPQHRLGAAS